MSEARTQRGTRELRLSARGDELRLRLLELALHLVGGDCAGCRGCRGEGVLARVGGRRGRLRRRACGEQGCEVRLLRHDLLGARPVPLLHLGPHLLTRRAGGWRSGLGLAVRPSSSPSASGAPLLHPLRLGPHLCQLELQPVPLGLLRRAKPRALGVALLQALRRLGEG